MTVIQSTHKRLEPSCNLQEHMIAAMAGLSREEAVQCLVRLEQPDIEQLTETGSGLKFKDCCAAMLSSVPLWLCHQMKHPP